MEITRCGYRCDLCKAYGDNIINDDKRDTISALWKKYYDLTLEPVEIYCDGCRCHASDAVLIDEYCPVRTCVIDKGLHSCADCSEWPCNTFYERKGLTLEEAKAHIGDDFDEEEFYEYLGAFDNFTRINKIREEKGLKAVSVNVNI